MKKVVITGSTGFIGANLAQCLAEKGIEIFALCRAGSVARARLEGYPGIQIVECDLLDTDRILSLIPARDIDAVYHLAWENASGKRRSDLQDQVKNLQYLAPVVELTKKLGCSRLVVTGTVSEKLCANIDRTDTFFPSAYYLSCKRAAHSIMHQLALNANLDLVWCTFCHPIGKYNKLDQLVANTIGKLLHGESPEFHEGQNLFDILSVKDLAEALYLAGNCPLNGEEYFVGSGSPQKLSCYLESVGKIVNPRIPLRFGDLIGKELPLEAAWLDPASFFAETGFHPRINFEEAVRETVEWVRGQQQEQSQRSF